MREQLRDAYNVFCRKHKPGLCCAVREDRPVPSFLDAESWAFGYTVPQQVGWAGKFPVQSGPGGE